MRLAASPRELSNFLGEPVADASTVTSARKRNASPRCVVEIRSGRRYMTVSPPKIDWIMRRTKPARHALKIQG
jgi:hypothetical protein